MKEKLSLLYKILIVIVSGIGIYLNIVAFSLPYALIYYTIQSNIWCFVFYLVVVILMLFKKLERNNIYYIFKGMISMSITITMVVYQMLLLSPSGMGAYNGLPVECAFVHLITPLLVISDYFIFGKKGNLKKSYPFIWNFTLIAYFLFTLFYMSMGGTFLNGKSYPYFFMNMDRYGVLGVLFNGLIVYVFFLGVGTIVQTIDYKLGKNQQ